VKASLKRKQVILIRKDLKMRRGKEIAQGSHASMEFLVSQLRRASDTTIALDDDARAWIDIGMAKVCLRVNSEEELISYHEKALAAGLQSHLIRDSGRTEFGGVPTYTACAIGPALVDRIDAITGELTPY
jgi:PTH2 family peptidyl-tRNA hydrolase